MNLKPRLSSDGSLIAIDGGWHLEVAAGNSSHYRLSQLDDEGISPRRRFLWGPPLAVTLRARAGSQAQPGTWGFGLWNDPYPLAPGFGGGAWRLPALPQAAWFFHSSPNSYLSLQDDLPAQGFLAQTFRGGRVRPPLALAGAILPFAPRESRRRLRQFVSEDSRRVVADPTAWHTYVIGWNPRQTVLSVDGTVVLDCAISPRPPLAIVIWVDNQFARFDPQGRIRWGLESSAERAWLEVADVDIRPGRPLPA